MTKTRRGIALLAATVFITACSSRPVLIESVRARALSASLHVNFTRAAEAGDRAVMADTDDASEAAAAEARRGTDAAQKDFEELTGVLQQLGYANEAGHLKQFASGFEEYRKLDAEILPLAVENSNLKAQRLSFEEGQQAADALLSSLQARSDGKSADVQLNAARCEAAVLRIQVLQARHIAEASDEKMAAVERQMADAARVAGEMLHRVDATGQPEAHDAGNAREALDRFMAVNARIVELSRRNSNVRSLALSLGRKRVVVAQCEDHLTTLDALLNAREFQGVR